MRLQPSQTPDNARDQFWVPGRDGVVVSADGRTDDLERSGPDEVKVGAQVHQTLGVVALHVDDLAL